MSIFRTVRQTKQAQTTPNHKILSTLDSVKCIYVLQVVKYCQLKMSINGRKSIKIP